MNLTQKTMMLMTLAVAAFGADRKLGFHAEFPFTVGKATLPAGAYVVERTSLLAPVVTLRNVAEKRSAILQFATMAANNGKSDKASIVFHCASGTCKVAELNNLIAGSTHVGFVGKTGKDNGQMISLSLKPVQAE